MIHIFTHTIDEDKYHPFHKGETLSTLGCYTCDYRFHSLWISPSFFSSSVVGCAMTEEEFSKTRTDAVDVCTCMCTQKLNTGTGLPVDSSLEPAQDFTYTRTPPLPATIRQHGDSFMISRLNDTKCVPSELV